MIVSGSSPLPCSGLMRAKNSDVDILVEFSAPAGVEFINLGNYLERLLDIRVDLASRNGIKPHYFQRIRGGLDMSDRSADLRKLNELTKLKKLYTPFFLACDCTAVIATASTMSCAVQPRERSLQGRSRPCRMGPMAVPPVRRSVSL